MFYHVKNIKISLMLLKTKGSTAYLLQYTFKSFLNFSDMVLEILKNFAIIVLVPVNRHGQVLI